MAGKDSEGRARKRQTCGKREEGSSPYNQFMDPPCTASMV